MSSYFRVGPPARFNAVRSSTPDTRGPSLTPDPIQRLTAALSDRYRIEREIGAGGMATVYLERDGLELRPLRGLARLRLEPAILSLGNCPRAPTIASERC